MKILEYILYDSDDKKIMPIKKFRTLESAKRDLNNLESLLGLDKRNNI
jgi:hypothetical protein